MLMLHPLRRPGLILWLLLAVMGSPTIGWAETTVYVTKSFEVRDHDQPVKYVFNGDTCVARVTGSLAPTTRVQRLRLHPGWNLLSLAVTATNAFHQITNSSSSILPSASAFRWNPTPLSWRPVGPDETLPAGTVLWLHAATNTSLALNGAYTDPTNRVIEAGGSFQPGSGLEALPLRDERVGLRAEVTLSSFAATDQQWQHDLPALPFSDSAFPEFLAPGEAVFLNVDAPAELEVPEAALRIRYYHPDHLGSTSVMTDADGELIEETVFYPFGHPRYEYQPRQIEENYQFTRKEQDKESGLHYFEARYLYGAAGRFITADPLYANPDGLRGATLGSFLHQPQRINLYAYGLNNPIRYNDPSGLDDVDKVSATADVVGVVAGGAEEASTLAYLAGFNPSKGGGTAMGVAGKTASVVSVAVKTAQFIHDPSSATGGQLANESAKALTGIVAPPVALVWSILDLTGYGPSAILEHTEKSIQANREAARLYTETAQIYGRMATQINQAEPVLRGQLEQIGAKVTYVNKAAKTVRETALKSLQGDTRSLEELNAEIRKVEGQIRQQKREERYWKERERKAR